MNDDLESLQSQWKESTMQTLTVSLEPSALQARSQRAVHAMMAVSAILLAGMAIGWFMSVGVLLIKALLDTPFTLADGGGFFATALWTAITLPFTRFTLAQRRKYREAGEALSGTPADIVRGRIRLLELELDAWTGSWGRYSLRFLLPFSTVVLFVLGVMFEPGRVVCFTLAALFAAFGGWLVRHRRHELPRLQAALAELRALADSLVG